MALKYDSILGKLRTKDTGSGVSITGGLVPKGAYNASTDYAVGDSVDYQGSSYVMYVNAVAGTPPTNSSYWQVLASKGDTGSTGETGSPGAPGPNQVTTSTSTNISGLIKGNGTSVSTAVAGTDYAAASHGHAIADVTNLQTTLDGKAAASHSHAQADVTGLTSALAAKSDTTHNHALASLSEKSYSSLTDKPTLGTAAPLNVPSTGNASATEVVKGDDTRLSDARTPTTHTHTKSQITDFTHTHPNTDITGLGTASTKNVAAAGNASTTEVVMGNDTRLTDARTPTTHSHAIADLPTGTTASTVALGNHTHSGYATTSHTHLKADVTDFAHTHPNTEITGLGTASTRNVPSTGNAATTEVVLGTDTRLTDSRTPTLHSHVATDTTSGTFDIARIPTGTTSTTVSLGNHTHANDHARQHSIISTADHTFPGGTTTFLRADGTFATPAGGSGSDPFLAKLKLAADHTNATVTPTAMTGMSFTYEADSTYTLEIYALVTAAAATTGVRFALDVSTAITNMGITFTHQLANTGTMTGGQAIADAAAVGTSSGVPTAAAITPVIGGGILVTGASSGTATLMFAAEVAASATCKAGSVLRVMKVV